MKQVELTSAPPESEGERGSAIVEFIAIAVIFLVPLVYLAMTASTLQGASFAAESSARDAAFSVVRQDGEPDVNRLARNIEMAFEAHGIPVDGSEALTLSCEASPCLSPGATVRAVVSVEVPLPLLPSISGLPTAISVSGEYTTVVPELRGQP